MRTPIPVSTRPQPLLPADLSVELDSFLLSLGLARPDSKRGRQAQRRRQAVRA